MVLLVKSQPGHHRPSQPTFSRSNSSTHAVRCASSWSSSARPGAGLDAAQSWTGWCSYHHEYPMKIKKNHDIKPIKHPKKSHDLYESPMKSGWIWSFTSLKIAEMRAFGDDSPNPKHHSRVRSQWGHYNLPCLSPGLEDEFRIQTHQLSTNRFFLQPLLIGKLLIFRVYMNLPEGILQYGCVWE